MSSPLKRMIHPTLKQILNKLYFGFLSGFLPRVVTSKYGIRLVKNFKDATFRFCFFGNYGFFYSRELSSIKEDFIFLDIGSNQGLYTILAATNNNCLSVHSFEPVDSTFGLCVENVRLNNVIKNCNLWNVGIGDGNLEVSEISFSEDHSGLSTMRDNEKNVDTTKKIIIVGHKFLNSIDNFGSFPVHIKVDVEGLEEQVISQVLQTDFSKNIKSIFFEMDERWINPESIYELMGRHGFKSFTKVGKSAVHYDVLATKEVIQDHDK